MFFSGYKHVPFGDIFVTKGTNTANNENIEMLKGEINKLGIEVDPRSDVCIDTEE